MWKIKGFERILFCLGDSAIPNGKASLLGMFNIIFVNQAEIECPKPGLFEKVIVSKTKDGVAFEKVNGTVLVVTNRDYQGLDNFNQLIAFLNGDRKYLKAKIE